MTTLTVYGGPLKRSILQRSYSILGQSYTEFEISPEELQLGLRCMNDVLAMIADQYGVDLGYNFPDYGDGNADDESGIPRGAVQAVSTLVAHELAPSIGATLGKEAESSKARARSSLIASYAKTSFVQMGRNTPRGQGNRYWNGLSPFFVAPISDDEVQQ